MRCRRNGILAVARGMFVRKSISSARRAASTCKHTPSPWPNEWLEDLPPLPRATSMQDPDGRIHESGGRRAFNRAEGFHPPMSRSETEVFRAGNFPTHLFSQRRGPRDTASITACRPVLKGATRLPGRNLKSGLPKMTRQYGTKIDARNDSDSGNHPASARERENRTSPERLRTPYTWGYGAGVCGPKRPGISLRRGGSNTRCRRPGGKGNLLHTVKLTKRESAGN